MVEEFKEAVQRRKARVESFLKWEYLRFSDDFKDIPRGTVLFGNAIIWGYPHIGRIFRLDKGLKEQFEHPFFIEEKVDGYNVRIFEHDGDIVALTRGGYICPFTIDRIPEFLDLRIFEENPDIIICGEVAGPGNPYIEESPPFIKEDVQFFVFDIMSKNKREFLPYTKKLELINRYNLPAVKTYGRFTSEDIQKIKEILFKMNEEGREGVVFKEDSERNKRVKYVTSNANLSDIRVTAKNMLQLPPEYFTNRLLRLVLFMEEEGIEKTEKLYKDLGKAFIDGLFDAIEQYKKEHRVSRKFLCKFNKKENALALIEQLSSASRHIQVIQNRLEKEGDYYILEFEKVYLNMTGFLGHILSGGLVFD